MLIYLSCQDEAREILNQLEVREMQEPGRLNRVLRLLEESYGSRAEERFEEKQEAYLAYRRAPGQSVAAYVSNLKRLRSEYLKEDEGTTISDRSFAQRLLTRAGLTRRERLDIFYSAGGKYDSKQIEQVMRFRCGKIHTEETSQKSSSSKPYPRLVDRSGKPAAPGKAFYPRRSDRKPYRSSHHQSHLADQEEPEGHGEDPEEDSDLEDLEQEALLAGQAEEQGDYEEDDEDFVEDEEEVEEIENLKEAYAAGWRAKQQSADTKKSRGYFQPKGKGKGKGKDTRKAEDRKKNSQCASCKQYGHWHGDPTCPNVISGKDPPRGGGKSPGKASSGAQCADGGDTPKEGTSVHRVNWSFPVDSLDGWSILKGYETESEEAKSEPEKDDLVEALRYAAGRLREAPQGRKTHKVALKSVLEALLAEEQSEETQARLRKKEYRAAREAERQQFSTAVKRHADESRPMEMDLKPQEVLQILPHLTKAEKRGSLQWYCAG